VLKAPGVGRQVVKDVLQLHDLAHREDCAEDGRAEE
jgi:hypothetical protein